MIDNPIYKPYSVKAFNNFILSYPYDSSTETINNSKRQCIYLLATLGTFKQELYSKNYVIALMLDIMDKSSCVYIVDINFRNFRYAVKNYHKHTEVLEMFKTYEEAVKYCRIKSYALIDMNNIPMTVR